jgi:hypothetical protein
MFIRPEEILMELTRTYKTKVFELADVIEWCMQVECDHIADIDLMNKYIYRAKVTKGTIALPLNVFRIFAVYDDNLNPIPRKGINTAYLHGLREYEGQTLNIEFMGVPMDYDCMPLVAASHKEACKKYIIMQVYADEADSNFNLYKIQENRKAEFAGLVVKAKQGFREWTADAIAALSRHSYNEPFKDLAARYADRKGFVPMINRKFGTSLETGFNSDINNINEEDMNVKEMLNQHIASINEQLRKVPHTFNYVFLMGVDGEFSNGIWTLPLFPTMKVDSLEGSLIETYLNGEMITVATTAYQDRIEIDLSYMPLQPNDRVTASVVPITN